MSEWDVSGLRAALWDAYEIWKERGDSAGKRAEGSVEVIYPPILGCSSREDAMRPKGIVIYSYALGPSREHFFLVGMEAHPDNSTWYSPNPCETAKRVVSQWLVECGLVESGGEH